MNTFIIGIVVALVLGIGTAVVFDHVGVQTAAFYAPEGVQLPHYEGEALNSGQLASAATE